MAEPIVGLTDAERRAGMGAILTDMSGTAWIVEGGSWIERSGRESQFASHCTLMDRFDRINRIKP